MFPWITLALVGQRTSHIPFGTGVTCPIYRYNPTTVAQAFASLALLYPGRVFLGVGTGERLNEQAATTQFGPYRERHDRLIEAIQLIRQLWGGQRISFQGRYFQTNQLKLYDVPPSPPPIFVAAGGPKSAHLAGQYGDGWITEAGGVKNQKLVAAFNQGAHDSGRDPATLGKRAEMFAVVGDQNEITRGAELWRFTGGAVDQPNPVDIQRAAQANPLDKVIQRLDHRDRSRHPHRRGAGGFGRRRDAVSALCATESAGRDRLLPHRGLAAAALAAGSAQHRVEVGHVGESCRDLIVGVDEAVGGMHLRDRAVRNLPATLAQVFDDVAALEVVDEIVEVDHVEPELTHPLVMRAPPLVSENRCVRDEFGGQLAAGNAQCGDVVEQARPAPRAAGRPLIPRRSTPREPAGRSPRPARAAGQSSRKSTATVRRSAVGSAPSLLSVEVLNSMTSGRSTS